MKIAKCAVVMVNVDREKEYRQALARHSRVADMQLVGSAIYLGVAVGLGASARQWERVVAKATSRRADTTSAPSLMSRVLGFNVHLSSLFSFKCQFAEVDGSVRQLYHWEKVAGRHLQPCS